MCKFDCNWRGSILPGAGPFQVEGQEPLQDLLVGEAGRPAVGGEDGLGKSAVRQAQAANTWMSLQSGDVAELRQP
jgi:hypothetical protein